MAIELRPVIEHEGVHCSLIIKRPAPAMTVVVLAGSDIGDLLVLPGFVFTELDQVVPCYLG